MEILVVGFIVAAIVFLLVRSFFKAAHDRDGGGCSGVCSKCSRKEDEDKMD